jgi:hypothetical protein
MLLRDGDGERTGEHRKVAAWRLDPQMCHLYWALRGSVPEIEEVAIGRSYRLAIEHMEVRAVNPEVHLDPLLTPLEEVIGCPSDETAHLNRDSHTGLCQIQTHSTNAGSRVGDLSGTGLFPQSAAASAHGSRIRVMDLTGPHRQTRRGGVERLLQGAWRCCSKVSGWYSGVDRASSLAWTLSASRHGSSTCRTPERTRRSLFPPRSSWSRP